MSKYCKTKSRFFVCLSQDTLQTKVLYENTKMLYQTGNQELSEPSNQVLSDW